MAMKKVLEELISRMWAAVVLVGLIVSLPASAAVVNHDARVEKASSAAQQAQAKYDEEPEAGLYILVATRNNEKQAQLVLADVAMLKMRGFVQKVKDKPVYHILAGPFHNMETAEKAKLKIVNNSLTNKASIVQLPAKPAPASEKAKIEEDEEPGDQD
jgi:hypothetical protein